MKVRIVTNNPVFARNGRLFERADQFGKPFDHEVDAKEGKELLALDGSPFREVDDEGNVIASAADVVETKEQEAKDNARTFKVQPDPKPEATDETKPPVADIAQVDETPAKEKKTITITTKPKPATGEETATQETGGSASDTTEATPPVSPDADTEGAVEV